MSRPGTVKIALPQHGHVTAILVAIDESTGYAVAVYSVARADGAPAYGAIGVPSGLVSEGWRAELKRRSTARMPSRQTSADAFHALHTPADFKGNDGDDKENQLGLLITASAQSAKRKREENNTTAAPTLIGYACDAVRTLIYWPSHSFAPRLLLHS